MQQYAKLAPKATYSFLSFLVFLSLSVFPFSCILPFLMLFHRSRVLSFVFNLFSPCSSQYIISTDISSSSLI